MGHVYETLQTLVSIITKRDDLGGEANGMYIEVAKNPDLGIVRVEDQDMDGIHARVVAFETAYSPFTDTRLYYEGIPTAYAKAVLKIKEAYSTRDLPAFREGCERLLGCIGGF